MWEVGGKGKGPTRRKKAERKKGKKAREEGEEKKKKKRKRKIREKTTYQTLRNLQLINQLPILRPANFNLDHPTRADVISVSSTQVVISNYLINNNKTIKQERNETKRTG